MVKAVAIFFGIIASLGVFPLLSGSADAAVVLGGTTALKQVQVSGGNRFDLLFDREIDPRQVKTEFYQEIIQISLNNVSVYPPKIFSVNASEISKVFAYQYTPKLVRCRLTVKGNAEDFKNRVTVRAHGRVLTVEVGPVEASKDQVTLQTAHAVPPPRPQEEARLQARDKAIFDKVIKSQGQEPLHLASNLTGRPEKTHFASGGNPLSSLIRVFLMLTVVLLLMAGCFVAVRRGLRGKGSKGWLTRMVKGKFGAHGKMIEVVATHYLGPKKSIAVVRIQGRQLVLGITDESINLISQIDGDDMDDVASELPSAAISAAAAAAGRNVSTGAGATKAGPAVFSDIFAAERYRPATPSPENAQRTGSAVRDQIRRRVEGLKNL